MRASTRRPANAPSPAGRQPRTVATASTIVSASTASTNEARNAVVIAGPMWAKLPIMRCLRGNSSQGRLGLVCALCANRIQRALGFRR